MNAIALLSSLSLAAFALSTSALAVPHEGWTADFEAGLAQAKKENKAVLVEFTGSDWCPPCIMMRKNVFSKKEFVESASKNFVLVELDFPNKDKELKKKNQPYAEKYKIEGYPTVILMDADGKEFNRFYASEFPKIEDFLAHLQKQLNRRDLD